MARIPRSFARRARSTASIFLGTPSGSECACISIAPLRFAHSLTAKKPETSPLAVTSWMYLSFEQVSLELGVDLTRSSHWLPRQCQICYCTTRCHATSECEHDGNGEDKHDGKKLLETL